MKKRVGKQGQTVGYRRVSTVDQNTSRQFDGIELDRVFEDKVSGKDLKRPQLIAMLAHVREGDTVKVHSMDRLGRNLDDLRKLVSDLTAKGVRVQFIKENLTFTGDENAMAKLMLNIMASIAQFALELMKERQREGIAIAKRNGVYKGRAKSLTKDKVASLRSRVKAGEAKAALAKEFGISRASVYNYIAN
jgi:DNA invertase Pin-like site-specific DNA recombinase